MLRVVPVDDLSRRYFGHLAHALFPHVCFVQAVQFSIGISKSMCSTHFPAFAKAIIDGLDNISFPTGEELKEEQRRWAQDDFLEGCVTAADGVHIRYTPTTNGHEVRE